MTPGIVLDIETRMDPLALAASGRRAAPRDLPAPLQFVTALAILAYERDDAGRFHNFKLAGHQTPKGGEASVVSSAERDLARVHASGGELVTFNGNHDLGILRFACLRHRAFVGGGARRWLEEPDGRHHDVMLELGRDGRWPSLNDVAAGLGFAAGNLARAVHSPAIERDKAEIDVVRTMLLHIHLEAERRNEPQLLIAGALALGRFVAGRVRSAPHLSSFLDTPFYASASRTLVPGQ
ncbi:hypothetical protein [Sphingomonas sp. R86520]|uniref:hypothetical protein n=1 Tax=Sphingomonas sp. R86520 TaxID=3093859 RepID=UPI0036D2FA02